MVSLFLFFRKEALRFGCWQTDTFISSVYGCLNRQLPLDYVQRQFVLFTLQLNCCGIIKSCTRTSQGNLITALRPIQFAFMT